ncbi:hypothetical protein G7062_06465 [Erysipelothrix sp. HDW6C]|uniref:phage tail tube protein n=1 Tax=Erysipelothrix sp. HDW6C TaxID=2714930 RepID=UPI00140843C3|nr:phage tail tube protein [Erysipelothrix sp. HDW6C]QIK69951.1 hypothetical protein G7062_06465 [Erysipelothrix sp. HDW6C]
MATVKAVSDVGTKLNHAAIGVDGVIPATGFEMLIGVKATPAKGQDPEQLDATELHDDRSASIPGRQSIPALQYTFNYTKDNSEKLKDVAGKRHAFLETLPEGNGFLIVGVLNYYSNGISLNAIHEGTLSVVAESIIEVSDVAAYLAK